QQNPPFKQSSYTLPAWLGAVESQDSLYRSCAGPDQRWLRAGMRASAISSTDVLFTDSTQCEKNKRFLVTFCRLAKSYPLLGAEALALRKSWIPAFAGMTS